MSSFGNAPSRQKSIDVEFNLLRTWSGTRLDLHRRLAQRAAIGAVLILVGGIVLPLLGSARSAAAAEAKIAKDELKKVTDGTRADEERATAALPAVEREAAIHASAKRLDSLLSGIAVVLNESPDTLVIRNLQFDVVAGELTLKIRAEAPTAEVARTFARRVGAAPGIKGAKASSIAKDSRGVGFNFTSTGVLAQ